MKKYLLFFISLFLVQNTEAQELSEAEQNAAVAYIQQAQSLLVGLRQLQQNYNLVALDKQKTDKQQKEEQQQILSMGSLQIKKFETLPSLKEDKGLKNNTLAYAKIFEETLTKDLGEIYIRTAEEEKKCSKCLSALKRAYELQKVDLQRGDVLVEKMSQSLDDVAKAYNIDLGESPEDKKADEIRAATDFVMAAGLVIGSASQAQNTLAAALQEVFSKKITPADFQALQPAYSASIEEAKRFFETELPKDFAAGATLYKNCETMLRQFDNINRKVLPELNQLLSKEKLSTEEKKQGEQLIKDFNAVAPTSKNCKNEMIALLQKMNE